MATSRHYADIIPDASRVVAVFISCADADSTYRARLEVHLSLLQRSCLVTTWHRATCAPGDDVFRRVNAQLDAAHLVLLLVSASYLSCDDCYEVEMKRALSRQRVGQTTVIPILVHD